MGDLLYVDFQRKCKIAGAHLRPIEVMRFSYVHGELIPLSFRIGNDTVQVLEVIDRWLGQDHSYFKVRAANNTVYILRHDRTCQLWSV